MITRLKWDIPPLLDKYNLIEFQSKDAKSVYAISLEWPKDGRTLVLGDVISTSRTKISLLGYKAPSLGYRQIDNKLEIDFPSYYKYISTCKKGCQWAYSLKMTNVRPRINHKVKIDLLEIKRKIEERVNLDISCNDVDCM